MSKLKNLLVDHQTCQLDVEPNQDETILPVTLAFKAKLALDGTIDKLKVRAAIHGDLDTFQGDTWVPTSSLRLVKLFLAFVGFGRARCNRSGSTATK